MIYFIQEGTTGPIKIGTSNNPRKRLEQLQTATHRKLRLIHYEEGGETREAVIHKWLAEYRIHGEWFRPAERLVNFINYLRHRGRGRDKDGEVVERGDTVGFVYRGSPLCGKGKTAARTENGKVAIALPDGRTLYINCNSLVVCDKKPFKGAA